MSLVVTCPIGFEPELQYVTKTIFSEFIPTEESLELIFSEDQEEGKVTFFNSKGSNQQSLELPLILFSSSVEDWLSEKSLPSLPLEEFDVSSIGQSLFNDKIPAIYGKSNFSSEEESKVRFGVDILGSVFFMLTLYDECVIQETDEHGRIDYQKTLVYKSGLYNRPIVNEYCEVLRCLLESLGIQFSKCKRQYSVILSHDVDHPVSHTYNAARFFKTLAADLVLRRSPKTAFFKFLSKVWPNTSQKFRLDPFFNLDFLMDVSESFGLVSQFNFITINGEGGIDGSYNIFSEALQNILKEINKRGHIIGIHPSYKSYLDPDKILNESNRLRQSMKEVGIEQSKLGGRQHYLRWKNPDTWQSYSDANLDYDSSLGSEYYCGFRTGSCYSYPVFNLISKKELPLIENPLVVMDVCLFKDFEKSITEIDQIKKGCKFFNGDFSLLVHNNYVVTERQKEWYQNLVKSIIE